MNDKLLFTVYKEYVMMARSSGGEITEMGFEPVMEKSILGNIYVGRVENIVKNLDAAFVSYEKNKIAYLPLKESVSPFAEDPSAPIKQGDNIVIQIVSEAVKTKPPKATASFIDITGRYAVLTYSKTGLGISSKITDKELRAKYSEEFSKYIYERCGKNETTGILRADYGIIIRTNAQSVDINTVRKEIDALIEEAGIIKNTALKHAGHTIVRAEEKNYITELRNTNLSEISEIVTDDEALYNEIFKYLKKYGLLDNRAEGFITLKEKEYIKNIYRIETVIKNALSERVWLKCGGYIVIQPTEALTVIDVNSGKFVIKSHDVNGAARRVNYEACDMIAKQLKLRNISGIIIVDFIDTDDGEREALLKYMRSRVEADRVKTVVVDITKLCLVEITRKKVKKTIYEQLSLQ